MDSEVATVWDSSSESLGRRERIGLSYGGAIEGDQAQCSSSAPRLERSGCTDTVLARAVLPPRKLSQKK